jgi:group I intron endonuclease
LSSGVYAIANLVNGKVYVGSSVDLRRRESDHFRALRGGYHCVTYLQNSYRKYGASNFVFMVLEYTLPEECLTREQFWLDELQPFKFENGYNRSPRAGSCLGFKHSIETRRRMSDRKFGVPMPDEVKRAISLALTGKVKSASHRANLWKNRQGWRHSDESKANISAGLLRAKLAGKSIGFPVGGKHTDETKRKMSEAGKGRPKTPEHRAKISAAVRAALAKKRGAE